MMNNTDNVEIHRRMEEDAHPESTPHVQETTNRCLLASEWTYACLGEHLVHVLEMVETLSLPSSQHEKQVEMLAKLPSRIEVPGFLFVTFMK